MTLSHLQIRTPKDDETAIEAAVQIFSSLLPSHVGLFKRFVYPPPRYAFEIYLLGQTIYFYITTPASRRTLLESLVHSAYPKSLIKHTRDPLEILLKSPRLTVGEMKLNYSYHLPIKTYAEFSAIDPLTALMGFLSKQDANARLAIQILVTAASFPWAGKTLDSRTRQVYDSKTGTVKEEKSKENASYLSQKVLFQGGRCAIRLIAGSTKTGHSPLIYLQNLAGTLGTFSLGEGNSLVFRRPLFNKQILLNRIKKRDFGLFDRRRQILNAQELATLWHPSGKLLSGVKNIAWGKTLLGEPPENLPIAERLTAEKKKELNFFATTVFKNKDNIFGILTPDRRRHVYIVGKTGAGKSTLIANMAIDDIRKGRGVGIIDPHGDLSEIILDYIPKRRMNDVVYLEPFDTKRPFAINVLEVRNQQHKDLVSSGIVSIFSKIYGNSWGPRLEYILRNTILTLLELQDVTLVDALSLLADKKYRLRIYPKIKDQILLNFWQNEFDQMTDRLRAESTSAVQNKVGQFVSSKMIRNIIGHTKSTINLEEIMNSGKILILNLSQGKLGEDNAALLGAMIITQIQLAAMNRSFVREEERRDFFLYVDEFQNFATISFIKILSEARKYRLALTLTNQYIEQLDEEIMHAIFGNVGSLVSFVVGARDATVLTKEFSQIFTEVDLVNIGKYEIVLKLCIDNMTSMPFPAKTLPLPALKNDNKEKIVRLSKEKYGRKVI
ncbi:hypothetical protein A2966_00015 [Candidatus Roizmanbacteria bacterium RIFCSPLOWO2_01_FULL_41_22]|uniref:Type IV secretion system coupling protein TraD DNA-binding domain-containing protein n=1 Tax=Candidatus Roizmanbacteria bacterium RIFCSPLOWO2_01_FULL_41_22 TaxID=1802067 RepID=A0A1F7J6Z1_9BACT|nr:MAG: hypothetical protein A2966_00015 [Candidatus Roizmanbacteria bacterium RIFCSPLOWO2_01_FULL_41_22]